MYARRNDVVDDAARNANNHGLCAGVSASRATATSIAG